ncbi:unnamed protein product, partial [Meganyctiphanes norvegica]
ASREFVSVSVSDHDIASWENGTLEVIRAERRHEGRYICEANNGVGSGLSKLVNLSVNEPPWFSAHNQQLSSVVGKMATLTCEAKGDTPLTISWAKDGVDISSMSRYGISERDSDSGRVSELVIRSTLVEDSGRYICTATNAHGSMTADSHLLVQ